MKPTDEQQKILDNDKKNLIVSASAGSGKTFIVVEQIINLICSAGVPIRRLLILTFTKAAASEMKSRLFKAILGQKSTPFLLEQLDDISVSDISTIDAFCEKIIKRNINKLNIDENFRVLDEKESKNLKIIAFNRVFDKASEDDFDEVYFAFKRKDQIFECLQSLQSYFDSQDDESLISSYEEQFEQKYNDSLSYLNSVLEAIKFKARKQIENINYQVLPSQYQEFYRALDEICNIKLNDDFFENCSLINNIVFPSLPRVKIEDISAKEALAGARDILKEMLAFTLEYQGITKGDKEGLKKGKLAKRLINLYKDYQETYQQIKQNIGALDFADLEKQVKELLKNDDVLKFLQDSYDYIFIDEYQDTNTLQEAIIKPIAKKGNFVAVGDPKQGIYGFRNASKEIMQKDIANFEGSDDGQALYLTGNFRSDDRLLSFVNKVFEKVMTEESAGIDYKKTSLLKGLVNFKKDEFPPVRVDVVLPEKEERYAEGVYSVKNDNIDKSYKYKDEVITLASRIEELLDSQIYDAKLEQFRKVTAGDIAVLFRGRSQLMQESVRYLQEKGFSCIADLKQSLLDDGQVQVLLSLLKLTLNFKDDISLVSVMSSALGGFTFDELAKMRKESDKDYFWQIVEASQEQKVIEFTRKLEEFKFDCASLGITRALNNLFNSKNYYLYIDSLPDKNVKLYHLQEFFKLIKQLGQDYDIASLLEKITNVDSTSSVPSAVNAITITTIHATKGLEYPIVILAGAGEKLKKVYNKSYNISSRFGLGCYLYNFEENLRLVSPIFLANKHYQKNREFVDELMIFYVAMTRGQNHLYILGSDSESNIMKDKELAKCDSYLDFIFYSFGQNFKEQFLSQEKVESGNYCFSLITCAEESSVQTPIEQEDFNEKLSLDIDKVSSYIDFAYPGKQYCKLSLKNSVSGLLHFEEGDELGASEREELLLNSDDEKVRSRQEAIDRGNAYHLALKLLDFDKIIDEKTLDEQFLSIKSRLEGEKLIDKVILLKDILLIKSVVKGKIFKEREFIMQSSLKEILNIDSDNEVIVQGIVDLFSLGDENVLIDYKFTSLRDENKLLERYKRQLDLYQLALTKAFDIKIDKIYLLSLGQAKLIEYKR